MKRIPESIIILLSIFMISSACSTRNQGKLMFGKLTCESLEDPLGIESPHPSFSWIVNSNGYDKTQAAYHLLVASSADLLAPGRADMWNSGKVGSDQSIHVEYNGEALQSGKQYWWTVMIRDQDGNESGWAPARSFEMGLLQDGDWQDALWISLGEDTRVSEYRFREYQTGRMEEPEIRESFPAGYFRKEIELPKRIVSARAYVCGLGYYELYLNGEKAGDHVLDPVPTSYDHHALYVTYDITSLLLPKRNTIGLILGNGFYGQDIAFNRNLAYGKPAAKLLMILVFNDGTTEYITSDGSWKANTGPIVFDNVYAGETCDARYENPGWDRNGFDDSGWGMATVVSPEVAEVRSQLMPPIRKVREMDPVNVFKGANGNWIVDFGQNIAGWVRISVEEKKGSVIEVRTAEALTRAGDEIHQGSLGGFATGVNQLDVYICKGSGKEEWEPRFTYQAFQFAEISGMSTKPSSENVKAILVCNDMKETGSFESSEPLLNKMVEVSKWTVIDNLHGFPEDCPAREKCGWLGDAHATAQFNNYTYDMALLYRKYSDDIESQLQPRKGRSGDGQFRMPDMVAPGRRKPGVAALDWGIAEVYVPWYLYLHYGDTKTFKDHYKEMKELIAYYLTFKNEQGVIENGLGDWCPPRWDRAGNPGAMECHPHISASAYFYDILRVMGVFAELMGEADYAGELLAERDALGEAFNRTCLEGIGEGTGKWYGSQTATVMALQFGLVPAPLKDDVVEGLKYDIIINKDTHHSMGIHGNRYLYSLLNDLGEVDLSYRLLTTPTFPSQAYILNCGMTTWPERQWEWDSGIEWDRSLNHPMQAGFAAFFYESLAGIRPQADDPGFRSITIRPVIPDQFEYAGAEISSPYGRISSQWSRKDKKGQLKLEIPFNTTAHVIPPILDGTSVRLHREDGTTITYENVHDESGISLGSGTYTLEFEMK